jgi:hypothetical protein
MIRYQVSSFVEEIYPRGINFLLLAEPSFGLKHFPASLKHLRTWRNMDSGLIIPDKTATNHIPIIFPLFELAQ